MSTENDLVKVASMYHEEGLTQAQIAEKRGVSRSLISKMLNDAKDAGIVEVIINSESIYTIRLERELEKKFRLKDAIVVDISNIQENEVSKRIGQKAALYLSENIIQYSKIGISWGRTLRKLVDTFPYISHPDATVYPLIGGLSDKYFDIQSNQLSFDLARKMRARPKYLYAPALVSNKTIFDELINNNAIHSVLQDAKVVDIALVGISSLDSENNMREIGYVNENDMEILNSQGGIGVINSRFYDLNGDELTSEINSLGIGISIKELKEISNVMTVVHGDQKSEAIKAALNAGIFNIIVTTNSLAEKLLED